MKNIVLTLLLLGFIACQDSKTKEATQSTQPSKTETKADVQIDTSTHIHIFACPMHPEVTGKKGDKCPKCGMALEHKD